MLFWAHVGAFVSHVKSWAMISVIPFNVSGSDLHSSGYADGVLSSLDSLKSVIRDLIQDWVLREKGFFLCFDVDDWFAFLGMLGTSNYLVKFLWFKRGFNILVSFSSNFSDVKKWFRWERNLICRFWCSFSLK